MEVLMINKIALIVVMSLITPAHADEKSSPWQPIPNPESSYIFGDDYQDLWGHGFIIIPDEPDPLCLPSKGTIVLVGQPHQYFCVLRGS